MAMDKLKEWLLEVAVKKMGPSAVRAGILGLLGWVLAKQDALQAFGIVADKAAQTITIHLDQLNLAVVAGLPAILGAVIKLLNHHTWF